jgi:heme O synthase-like polyprenyltransferase
MLQGLDTVLAVLLITLGAPLVGLIPVLIGWSRITAQWNSSEQRTFPKALSALTASICICPIGLFFESIYERLADRLFGLVDVLPIPLTIFILVGSLLDFAAIYMLSERNAARVPVLIGSVAVAVVNIVGFALFFASSRGISMWTN